MDLHIISFLLNLLHKACAFLETPSTGSVVSGRTILKYFPIGYYVNCDGGHLAFPIIKTNF